MIRRRPFIYVNLVGHHSLLVEDIHDLRVIRLLGLIQDQTFFQPSCRLRTGRCRGVTNSTTYWEASDRPFRDVNTIFNCTSNLDVTNTDFSRPFSITPNRRDFRKVDKEPVDENKRTVGAYGRYFVYRREMNPLNDLFFCDSTHLTWTSLWPSRPIRCPSSDRIVH